MLPANHIAFKEWAVVCAALAAGRQTILLRKGGIDEGREGFHVKHSEFWLLPTRFHQNASQLKPEAEPLWREMQAKANSNSFQVELYGVVEQVFEVRQLEVFDRLMEEHILSDQTVASRFHYRHPGLFVLAVRVFQIPNPFEIAESDYIAGCKSWVELPQALSTAGARPVLDDETFHSRTQAIAQRLNSPAE